MRASSATGVALLCMMSMVMAGCMGRASCGTGAKNAAAVQLPGATLRAEPLAEAILARCGTVVQALSGTAKGKSFAADCVIKSDGKRLTVVFLAPHGRLATLSYSTAEGVKWRSESVAIPDSFSPAYILFDLAAVNLPSDALRHALGPDFTVSEDGGARRICLKSGEALAEVAHLPSGDMRFTHMRYGYSYTIRSREAERQ